MQEIRQDRSDPDMEEVVASLQEIDTELQQLVQESAQILPDKARLQLQRETYRDGILAEVVDRLQNNRLKSDSTDKAMIPFYRCRDHLSVVDKTLVLDDKIVIPHSLRLGVLQKLHIAHPGMRRMVQLGRRYFYWPNMHDDIEKFVKSCDHCAQSASKLIMEPLHP
ncbi:rna-directed dna polymerase reverse transcriptase and integrase domain containing protein [Lasius niger]|uniref:RNA-directed DNA polymerase n=1 Tax=Lasius niger TaxID=67767 RepID=A0A0J7N0X4_LASNI|nr:rna-directed dna polymerase reverse transcriptase and integrase domain containing protein [Lasius niger]